MALTYTGRGAGLACAGAASCWPGIGLPWESDWLPRVGANTLYIEPGSHCENGFCESFNGKLRDELLSGEIFCSLNEARVVIEAWRRHYNSKRPHSSLGYRPPAPLARDRSHFTTEQPVPMQ